MWHLTSGWNKFKKEPYFCQVFSGPAEVIFGWTNDRMTNTVVSHMHLRLQEWEEEQVGGESTKKKTTFTIGMKNNCYAHTFHSVNGFGYFLPRCFSPLFPSAFVFFLIFCSTCKMLNRLGVTRNNGFHKRRTDQLPIREGIATRSPPTANILEMSLNHLMMKPQLWGIRKYRITLHYHYSHVHAYPEW